MLTAETRLPPLEVAPDTYLLRSAGPVVGAPLLLYTNCLVIRGTEPTVIDTGTAAGRDAWLADLRSLVDPSTIRWVILSHDGSGHRGNLTALLEHCPSATLVTCWTATQRMCGDGRIPTVRMQWVDDDTRLDIGDRVLRILRPPLYDSPASRVVFDQSTGVLWAGDVFACPMPARPVDHVDEVPPRLWEEGMAMLHHHGLSPWVSIVDRSSYADQVRKLQALGPSTVVGAHSPVITGANLAAAFEHLAALPDTAPPPHPAVPPHGADVRNPR